MIITDDGFIEVDITPDMYSRAEANAAALGELRNSIRRGEGNLCGFLGEEVVKIAFPGSTSQNTFQHDVDYDGCTFEVKTKDRTVRPKWDYEASVANFNARQNADYYVFVSLLRRGDVYVRGYVTGFISKADYMAKATFLKVGDYDPTNGWRVSADCYNVPYFELHNFLSLRNQEAA